MNSNCDHRNGDAVNNHRNGIHKTHQEAPFLTGHSRNIEVRADCVNSPACLPRQNLANACSHYVVSAQIGTSTPNQIRHLRAFASVHETLPGLAIPEDLSTNCVLASYLAHHCHQSRQVLWIKQTTFARRANPLPIQIVGVAVCSRSSTPVGES